MRHFSIIPNAPIYRKVLYRSKLLLHTEFMIERRQTELFCEWLDNYLNFEQIKKKEAFSLETMRFLVDRFKHPEKTFKSIHVAGSKGKGSVSTMIAHILDAAALPSGLYTSPHLLDFTERVSSARGPFTDTIYGRSCDIVVPLVDSIIPGSIPGGNDPSWFELITLFAFVTFREAGLPWAVIETGLGGRLDATNVICPEACVITPIELEHTEYLGDTIEKIAAEKAGIIKESVPVFIAEQRNVARLVFETVAAKRHAPVFCMTDAVNSIRTETSVDGLEVWITFNNLAGGARFDRPLHVKLALISEIQAHNAALAAYTVKTLLPGITEDLIEAGLSRAWLPGRFECVSRKPPIILDGAHTVRSIELTLDTFRKLYPGDAHLVFACAADKDVDSIATLFYEGFSRITITRPGDKKQSDLDHASAVFGRIFACHPKTSLTIDPDYATAISGAVDNARSGGMPLLITGSFYLVAEAKKILDARTRDPEN